MYDFGVRFVMICLIKLLYNTKLLTSSLADARHVPSSPQREPGVTPRRDGGGGRDDQCHPELVELLGERISEALGGHEPGAQAIAARLGRTGHHASM